MMQNTQETMQAANDVSAAVVNLFALYHPKLPADIGRLDVLERQVRLDADSSRWNTATKDLQQIQTVWNRVKLQVGPMVVKR